MFSKPTTEIPSIAKIAVPKNSGRRADEDHHGRLSDGFKPVLKIQQKIIPNPTAWIIFAIIENGDKYLQQEKSSVLDYRLCYGGIYFKIRPFNLDI